VTGIAIAVGIAISSLEVLAIVALSARDGRYISARERFHREANRYIEEVTRAGSGCQYIDSLFPHPYLGFVHHRNAPCGLPNINNAGLFGVDFPTERLTDRFVILVTGGSVAAQLAQIVPNGPRYLETILNESYLSPTGKPFLVLNGGDGAWKQPQQAILFLLWSDVVDGLITLDGFNEVGAVAGGLRFEYPANNFALVNPLATEGYDAVVIRWFLGRLVGRVSSNPITSRSHAVFMAVRAARRVLDHQARVERHKRTTVESLFWLPPEWDDNKRIGAALEQYKKYVRSMDAIGRDRKIRTAYFIQPVPAIGKRLTPEERAVAGDLSYGPLYRRMTDALLSLRGEGIPVFSLLEVFAGIEETLYSDSIHLMRDARGESPGYRLMAEKIAHTLAKAWKLQGRRSRLVPESQSCHGTFPPRDLRLVSKPTDVGDQIALAMAITVRGATSASPAMAGSRTIHAVRAVS
jgi:hypothetical protein